MAAFAANATGSQSADGKTLTLTDLSNYTSNTENYTIADFITRQFILKDSAGNTLATLNLGSDLSVDYQLTKDQYIEATLNLAGVAPYTKVIDLPLQRITQNIYRTLLASGCCCQSVVVEQTLSIADNYFLGASIEGLSGNGPGFDRDISAAYAYLNSIS